ncbi:MAG: phage major capsid protein, partial [Candidatus Melainabacteria bacterium]|nr:phage major capsid protein [Candidatus Melainabacteria bacterium]
MPTQAAIATISAILKDLYLGPVVEQFNNKVLLFQRLETRSQELVGNQAVIPLHVKRSGGIGSRGETDALPDSSAQGYDRAVYDLKEHYGRIQVTGLSMVKSANDSGAFLRVLKGELDGIRADLLKDMARQSYGDGTAAIIGVTDNGGGSNDLPLDDDEPLRKGQIYLNMVVDVGTLADPTVIVSARTVTDVVISTATVTVDGAAFDTVDATNFIFRAGNAAASSVSNEMTGLQALVAIDDTFTPGGIDETDAGNGFWANQRDTT